MSSLQLVYESEQSKPDIRSGRKLRNFKELTPKRIEEMKSILEKEQKRPITYEEAEEISYELLELFDTLAGKRRIVRVDENDELELKESNFDNRGGHDQTDRDLKSNKNLTSGEVWLD